MKLYYFTREISEDITNITKNRYYGTSSPSDYNNFLSHSILSGYKDIVYVFRGSGFRIENSTRYTGAVPVRFYFQQSTTSMGSMSDGMFIQTLNRLEGDSSRDDGESSNANTGNVIFSISSGNDISFIDGYVNVKFSLYGIYTTEKDFSLINASNSYDYNIRLKGYLIVDGKYYDEASKTWTSEKKKITIDVKNGSIVSNKTSDMSATDNDGYFAPIKGTVAPLEFQLTEANLFRSNKNSELDCLGAVILYNFSVEYKPRYSIVSSDRSSNQYRKVITVNGFTDKKQIDLNIGTNNNNQDSPSFVRTSSAGDYLENMTYRNSSGTYGERPEIHLLKRLAKYYSKMRRTMSATIKAGNDIFRTLYKHNGRTFFGIDASHNWRDDEQQVKFMEVTNE